MLSLEPVIGAIAAGNAVVLKPSEVAPATSAMFAKVFPEYVDNSCIRVVEGAIHETTALLKQRWDKIFYTGSEKIIIIKQKSTNRNLSMLLFVYMQVIPESQKL